MEHKIEILGEERFFWITHDILGIVVNHPKWSTCGFGETLQEAISDVINSALIMKEFYCEIPDNELSEEAQKLKRWLIPIKKS